MFMIFNKSFIFYPFIQKLPCYFVIKGNSGGGETVFNIFILGGKNNQFLAIKIAKAFGRTSE